MTSTDEIFKLANQSIDELLRETSSQPPHNPHLSSSPTTEPLQIEDVNNDTKNIVNSSTKETPVFNGPLGLLHQVDAQSAVRDGQFVGLAVGAVQHVGRLRENHRRRRETAGQPPEEPVPATAERRSRAAHGAPRKLCGLAARPT
ncbi:hypothetical protein KL914_004992 [Ogataea haglerorum]|nr:hypothetical protein KL914_004992 [Ogataea haglerorum]